MELSWSTKLRIAGSVGAGVVLIGIIGWPLARPSEPFAPVQVANLGLADGVVLVVLAFVAGLAGYFISWPNGLEIGILAVPSGLAIWGVRTGNIASLLQQSPSFEQREALLAALKWEPIFWLAIVGVGLGAVYCGGKLWPTPVKVGEGSGAKPFSQRHLNSIVALAGCTFIAYFALNILVQDVRLVNEGAASVVGQPATGQIVFGVVVAFGFAAFLAKNFLNSGYMCPIIATAVVHPVAIVVSYRSDVLFHLTRSWPAVFFPNSVVAILPLQMVAFGTIGSIAGYWMGVRYNFQRKHAIR